MTMVIDTQSRHYGNIGYPDNMYSSQLHTSPQFTDPWGPHSTAPSHAPFATAMPKQEVPRAMPISYPQNPVSAPAMVSGSSYTNAGFGGSELLNMSQDIPRSTYPPDQTYQTSPQSNNSLNQSSYPTLNYAQSLQQQQQQQQDVRKMSDP